VKLEGRMLKYGKGLFSALVLFSMLGCTSMLFGQVELIAPQVEVREGNRQVEVFWNDPEPEDLTYIHQPVLGTAAFPWRGNASVLSGGFFLGACDWTYSVGISLLPVGRWELNWREVANWKTGAQRTRTQAVSNLDTDYDLSDGVTFRISSAGLFEPDLEGWSGPQPGPGGLYQGGQAFPESTVVFTISCTSGGDLDASGGVILFTWESVQGQGEDLGDVVESGSFEVTQAGVPVEIVKGLVMTFPAGTYVSGESFEMGVRVPILSGDRLAISAETFEGYLVLRHSIEDRPTQYKVVANISKCDSFEFFENQEGQPDPYGERYYLDLGIDVNEPGVAINPTEHTVLNGFPYQYGVVTYDISAEHEELLSPVEWQLVYPSVPPAPNAGHVYIVPNPYVRRAGWDIGEPKVSFMNIPEGSVIRIYSVSGDYVDTIYPDDYSYDESLQQGSADWNLKNADGTKVVSGVYVYKLTSKHGEKTGRFIIVR
jgi:hypothetical protein